MKSGAAFPLWYAALHTQHPLVLPYALQHCQTGRCTPD
jgi:hypothetical protein